MQIAVLSNLTTDVLIRLLPKEYDCYLPPGFDGWIEEILAHDSGLKRHRPEVIFLLLDGTYLLRQALTVDGGKAELDRVLQYIEKIAADYADEAVFVSTLDIPQRSILPASALRPERNWESHWYERLCQMSLRYRNLAVFDLKELVEQQGRERFYAPRLWYLGGLPFSMHGNRVLAKTMSRFVETCRGFRKKCLVLDLDDTLWGGVLGEEGIEGVLLGPTGEGAQYRDFQLRLRELKDTGVLLAVASKNNDADVREMFRLHPHMVLRENDFAVIKANWNPKSQNLREIAVELNIGIDSLVFFDDNPLEREEIRQSLPEVAVPDFPHPSRLEETAVTLFRNYFHTVRVTDEDAKKTLLYLQEEQRKKSVVEAPSFDDYLRSLNLRIAVHTATFDEIPRIAQLTHKTNQFNLTTYRYAPVDIAEKLRSPDWRIYTVHVSDRFVDNGLVSVVIVHLTRRSKAEETVAKIDTFLMSCRVMGRFIEDAVLETIEERLRADNIRHIRADYIPTSKNLPVASLYERLGYTLLETLQDGRKRYQLDCRDEKPLRRFYATVDVDEPLERSSAALPSIKQGTDRPMPVSNLAGST